jgi:hypothetical protein
VQPAQHGALLLLMCLHAAQDVVQRVVGLEEVRAVFTSLTGLFRNLNYSAAGSPQHTRYADEIEALARAHATSG